MKFQLFRSSAQSCLPFFPTSTRLSDARLAHAGLWLPWKLQYQKTRSDPDTWMEETTFFHWNPLLFKKKEHQEAIVEPMSFGDLSFKEKNLSNYSTNATLQLNPSLLFLQSRILRLQPGYLVSTTAFRDWRHGDLRFGSPESLSVQQIISAIFRGGILKLPTSILELGEMWWTETRNRMCRWEIKNMDIDTCVISPPLIWYYSNWFGDFWYLCYPFLVFVISFDSSCFDYYCCVGMPQKNSRKQVWMSALAAASSVDKLKGTSSAMYSDLDLLISREM